VLTKNATLILFTLEFLKQERKGRGIGFVGNKSGVEILVHTN
jgi:hypothetical protein